MLNVSVVLPVVNEEANLEPLVRRLVATLGALPVSFDIVVVDDGSTDGSVAKVQAMHAEFPQLRQVVLSRNFGHQAAIAAGLEHARGDAVIVMDADLQKPPELVGELVRRWREGFDVVYTVCEAARGSLLERLASRLYYFALGRLAAGVRPGAADFYLLDRKAVDAVRACPDRHLYLRGLVGWIGFKQVALPYRADARIAGRPGYSWRKRWVLALDGLTASSSTPLYIAGWLGLAVSGLALAYLLYDVVQWFRGATVTGSASLIGAVLLLGGVQLASLGIMGLYLGRTFEQAKGRPRYFIARRDFF